MTRWLAMLENGTYTPTAFNTGYTDVFAALMRQLRPNQRVVNYSCPATSTATMINGSCFFTDEGLALHDEFTGPQLDAAVTFLRGHPEQVDPITISVGAADLLDVFYGCEGDTACILHSGLAAQLGRNLATILGQLRAAAPHARILLLLPHNSAIFNLPHSNLLWGTFIVEMRAVAATRNVRVVDAFAAITLAGRECQLTFLCDADPDGHPNDAGYALLGHLFYAAAGYRSDH